MLTLPLRLSEKFLNNYLKLDPEFTDKLKPLVHHAFEVYFSTLNTSIFINFDDEAVQLTPSPLYEIGATIRSTPLTLLRFMLSPEQDRAALYKEIKIEGNLEFCNHVMQFFDELDLDWEEWLANVFGDKISYYLSQVTRSTWQFKKRVQSKFRKDLSDYLHEEIRVTPSKEEILDFIEDVADLRRDTDRIAARLQQLEQTMLRHL